ncbi:MAG: hypothetical protein WD271_12950 [Acidimicrobiia bacterium]
MRHRFGFLTAGVLIAGGVLLLPAHALGAATASGCKGTAVSFDADGKKLDTVTAPGPGGTSDNPFEVDPEGTVKWEASAAPAVPDDGTWTVETKSTPKLSFGGDGGLDQSSGTEALKDHLVVDVPIIGETRVASGKFFVKVVVEGGGVTCTMSGYVKINGSPLGTPIFWGGVILGALGLLLAFTATPTATAGATAGGAGATAGGAGSAPAPEPAPEPVEGSPEWDEPPPPAADPT